MNLFQWVSDLIRGKKKNKVAQVDNQWLTTLATGVNLVHGFLSIGDYLYAVTQVAPAILVKIDKSSGNVVASLTFPNDGDHDNGIDLTYDSVTGLLYVLFTESKVVVDSVNPATLARANVINDATYSIGQGSITTDGTYLYVGQQNTSASKSRVISYKLSDFLEEENVESAAFQGQFHAIKYDALSSKIYATTLSGYVYRLTPSPGLAIEETVSVSLPGTTKFTDDFAITSTHLWLGTEITQPGFVVRIVKSDLTTYSIYDSGLGLACFAVAYDGVRYVYAVFDGSPGYLWRIDLNTLAFVMWRFATGQNRPNEIIAEGDLVFFTFYLSPAQVSKTDFSQGSGSMSHRVFNIAGLTASYQNMYDLMLLIPGAIPTSGIMPDRVQQLSITPEVGNSGDVYVSDRNYANNVGLVLESMYKSSDRNSICLRDYYVKGDGQGIVVDVESV